MLKEGVKLADIIAAKKLLRSNGYEVVKISKTMEIDMKDCEVKSCSDEDKDCSSCSCSICIALNS